VIYRTAAPRAPWYVIPSNHKWFRDLAISSILVDTLEEMNPQNPKPSVDLKAIRLRYHSAKIEQKKDDVMFLRRSVPTHRSRKQNHNRIGSQS
jgi:Polyphosphate kinase 2 (PPK2)